MKARAALIRAIVLSSVAVLFLAASLPAQVLLVANSASGTVSQLNSFARTVTKTLTVPAPGFPDPLGVAINPAVTLAAVFNNAAPHRVDFYDLTSASTTPSGPSVPLTGGFGQGSEIAFTSDGACVVVSHGPGSGQVSSIKVATRTEVSVVGPNGRGVGTVPGHPHLAISVGAFTPPPIGGAFSVLTVASDCSATSSAPISLGPPPDGTPDTVTAFPNGQGALVTSESGFIHVLSISSGGAVTWVKKFDVGDTPESIAITPDGRHAYVYKGSGKLRILGIDLLNNVTDTGVEITVPAFAFPGFTGNFVATDGNTVFVSGTGGPGNTVITMVSVPTNTVVGTVTVGTAPFGMAYGGPMCPAHTVHGHLDTNVLDGHNGSSDVHHGEHGHLVTTSECLAAGHQMVANGHHLGLTPEATDGAIPSALTPEPDFVAALNQDGLNAPAAPGTIVQLFGSAKGLFLDLADLRPALEFTPPLSGSPLYRTTSLPEVAIGGVKAEVLFSGLAPGLRGVWQINVRIPDGTQSGRVPVTIAYNGDAVTSVDLAVE